MSSPSCSADAFLSFDSFYFRWLRLDVGLESCMMVECLNSSWWGREMSWVLIRRCLMLPAVFGFPAIALLSRRFWPHPIVVLGQGVFSFLYLMFISFSCQGGWAITLEGNGFPRIERLTGISHNTIINWVKLAGLSLSQQPDYDDIP